MVSSAGFVWVGTDCEGRSVGGKDDGTAWQADNIRIDNKRKRVLFIENLYIHNLSVKLDMNIVLKLIHMFLQKVIKRRSGDLSLYPDVGLRGSRFFHSSPVSYALDISIKSSI